MGPIAFLRQFLARHRYLQGVLAKIKESESMGIRISGNTSILFEDCTFENDSPEGFYVTSIKAIRPTIYTGMELGMMNVQALGAMYNRNERNKLDDARAIFYEGLEPISESRDIESLLMMNLLLVGRLVLTTPQYKQFATLFGIDAAARIDALEVQLVQDTKDAMAQHGNEAIAQAYGDYQILPTVQFVPWFDMPPVAFEYHNGEEVQSS